jgi:hypothetical protein
MGEPVSPASWTGKLLHEALRWQQETVSASGAGCGQRLPAPPDWLMLAVATQVSNPDAHSARGAASNGREDAQEPQEAGPGKAPQQFLVQR